MGMKGMKNSSRISDLPEDIIECILARLPIQDVVRTSILSRRWRYKWTIVPVLVFDDEAIHHSTFYSNLPPICLMMFEDGLVKVIYGVFCQHKGPIHKFSLSVKTMRRSYLDINHWINFLSRNGIREFILEFHCKDRFKVHSSLFSCVNLRELRLRGCIIKSLPSTFNGFNELTCLKLEYVTVNNEGFENLIAKCSQLETLHLLLMDGLDRLHIDHAPKLKSLYFSGSLNYKCLMNTLSLLRAIIYFSQLPDMNDENQCNGGSISMINNLNCLSNLRMFLLGSYFLKFIAEGSVRKLLPLTFNHLVLVHFFRLMFDDISSFSFVLGLITSSPNLKKLVVMACRTTNSAADQMKRVAEYLEGDSHSISCLMKLRYVEMKDLSGVEPKMELIKLILGKSPSLERMQIVPNETDHGFRERESKLLKDLIQFP
ncbi:hypothetical protein REPUB_Repub01dG0036200 [Reevesia pubescens]